MSAESLAWKLGPPLGVHLTPAGATAYAQLLASALGR